MEREVLTIETLRPREDIQLALDARDGDDSTGPLARILPLPNLDLADEHELPSRRLDIVEPPKAETTIVFESVDCVEYDVENAVLALALEALGHGERLGFLFQLSVLNGHRNGGLG